MSKPKVLIFAPREEPPETINALEGVGCELVFGDRDDPSSPVAKLLAGSAHFCMHEELGTDPGVYYVWDAAEAGR